MLIELFRYYTSSYCTLGLFFLRTANGAQDERLFLCYTLEDTYHPQKVPSATRIPPGRYQIAFHFGNHFSRYRARFPRIHPTNAHGMLEITNVPGYRNILIHIGNYAKDTEGCILVGFYPSITSGNEPCILQSQDAYALIYPLLSDALLSNQEVYISIVDYDTPE